MSRYRKTQCMQCPYLAQCNPRMRILQNYCGSQGDRVGDVEKEQSRFCRLHTAQFVKMDRGSRQDVLIGLQVRKQRARASTESDSRNDNPLRRQVKGGRLTPLA